MWEMITRECNGRHYHIEFLREYSTYDRHIDGAWIAILKIKRNKEIVFHYEYGKITDRMDDFDKIIYQEIVDTYNKL
jgi:hypothetical protein